MWKTQRKSAEEALGDFLQRVGKDKINEFRAAYVAGAAFSNVKVEPRPAPMLMGSLGLNAASSKSRKSTGPRTQQVLSLVCVFSFVCVCVRIPVVIRMYLLLYIHTFTLARSLAPAARA
jgi:hypothetical protein